MPRKIKRVLRSRETMEGAGVHLKRAFGYHEVPQLDPFLLLDDFHSDRPEDYLKGFPWHPHRGIETITYVLQGRVEHGDSLGNSGVIGSGDVQWMTAGSGIIHQEMPKGSDTGVMWGFQLWANLPTSHKMMDPRYRDVKAKQIPEVSLDEGVRAKIISGELEGTSGPVQDVVTDPEYLDVTIPPKTSFYHTIEKGKNAFAYVLEGAGHFDDRWDGGSIHGPETLITLEDGDHVVIAAGPDGVRFLLVSGIPIGEPVAWYGPIVMNTQDELRIAFREYQKGTFIKYKP